MKISGLWTWPSRMSGTTRAAISWYITLLTLLANVALLAAAIKYLRA